MGTLRIASRWTFATLVLGLGMSWLRSEPTLAEHASLTADRATLEMLSRGPQPVGPKSDVAVSSRTAIPGIRPTESAETLPVVAEEPAEADVAPVATAAPAVVDVDASTDSKMVYRVCRVTAYCDRGITAAGVPSGVGQCAAPGDIPFGTKVYVPSLKRTFVVTDRTHKRFRQNTVDLFMTHEDACLQFGERYLEVEFQLPPNKGLIQSFRRGA